MCSSILKVCYERLGLRHVPFKPALHDSNTWQACKGVVAFAAPSYGLPDAGMFVEGIWKIQVSAKEETSKGLCNLTQLWAIALMLASQLQKLTVLSFQTHACKLFASQHAQQA